MALRNAFLWTEQGSGFSRSLAAADFGAPTDQPKILVAVKSFGWLLEIPQQAGTTLL
jgi:hypothetical protein